MTAFVSPVHPLPPGITIEDRNDVGFIRPFYAAHWLADFMVLRGRIIRPEDVDAIIAKDERGAVIGAVTWRIEGFTAAIITLNSFTERRGVATHLILEVIDRAKSRGCRMMTVWVLNDALSSMRFFQLRGFRFRSIWPGLDTIRELKPGVPLVGESGIPILDEIEMEMEL